MEDIDYLKIADAVKFYGRRGFSEVTVPWNVDLEVINSTIFMLVPAIMGILFDYQIQ